MHSFNWKQQFDNNNNNNNNNNDDDDDDDNNNNNKHLNFSFFSFVAIFFLI